MLEINDFFVRIESGDRTPVQGTDICHWHFEWQWKGFECRIDNLSGFIRMRQSGQDLDPKLAPNVVRGLEAVPGQWVLFGTLCPKSGLLCDLQKTPSSRDQSHVTREKLKLVVTDIFRWNSHSLKGLPFRTRRSGLEDLLIEHTSDEVQLSPSLKVESWDQAHSLVQSANRFGARGVIAKSLGLEAGSKGLLIPLEQSEPPVFAVILRAQIQPLYTCYCVGIRRGMKLVPINQVVAASKSLQAELNQWVYDHTLQKFGSTRIVSTEKIVKIDFEAIRQSTRHKSGFEVIGPRVTQLCHQFGIAQISTTNCLERLAPHYFRPPDLRRQPKPKCTLDLQNRSDNTYTSLVLTK